MDFPGFVYGSYESLAVTADSEMTMNWYPERMESQGATTKWALYPTPGLELIADSTYQRGRGHGTAAGREFAVIGDFFYEILQSGAPVSRGAVLADANPATISYNGDGGGEVFITSGGNGYIYTLSTGAFAQVAALNGKATMGDHLDGYFLALDANTSTFYISNLLDGLTWTTGTDFAQRSQASDDWVSMIVIGKYFWLLGSETSEVWYNTGASFPFAPHPSGLIPYGCAAAFSVSQVDSGLAWLGGSVSGGYYVLKASGFAPEVISNVPQQVAMSRYSQVEDAVADSYNDLGHTFYLLSFPTANKTWVFDATTGLWSERGTWIQEDGVFVDWRARFHAFAFGEHRFLDSETGAHYKLSYTTGTDVSMADVGQPFVRRPIRRVRRTPALMMENTRVFFSAFELDLEPGLGLVTGQGSNPLVCLRMSNDGGKTWGNEVFRSAGGIGEYSTRVRWNRLGQARRRVFEVAVSDPIPWKLTGAYLDLGQAPRGQGVQAGVQQ